MRIFASTQVGWGVDAQTVARLVHKDRKGWQAHAPGAWGTGRRGGIVMCWEQQRGACRVRDSLEMSTVD